ncbi:MAG: hypothetical protein H0Z33_13180 [Bacillaceae bacterium]|nr:hypothetical protein [Bacillaceae bacterium]
MKLNENWPDIQDPNAEIHVIVPGTPQAVENMKEELGLVFPVMPVSDLTFHQTFGLIIKDQQNQLWPERGYAIVKDGYIVKAEATDYAGENALQIVQSAVNE